MAVEIFTHQQFEQALIEAWQIITGEPDTDIVRLGVVGGEYTYRVMVSNDAGIAIDVRSSVRPDGTSAGTGEDSIRLVVRYSDGAGWKVRGKGPDAYTTRVKGWESRLAHKLAGLYDALTPIRRRVPAGGRLCECQSGANKGRYFARVDGQFACWLD